MTIRVENHHSFLIVEHDPLLYEDSQEMVVRLAQVLKQISREATLLLLRIGTRIPSGDDKQWLATFSLGVSIQTVSTSKLFDKESKREQ